MSTKRNPYKSRDMMTRREVARILGITFQTVGQTEARALRKLRERLRNDPIVREVLRRGVR